MQKYSYLFLHWICNDQRFEICKSYSVDRLYLIFTKMDGCFEEINGNKYLTLVSANESKEKKN